MSARYYVSTDGAGRWQLTVLGTDKTDSYPLPCMIPGLVEQLDEWRRWRDALSAGLSVATDSDNELARVFADLLGSSLYGSRQDMSRVAARAQWPILSEGLRELHPAQWECGNPRHTDPEVGCPECSEVCATCDRTMPCPTVRELDRIDKEMGL